MAVNVTSKVLELPQTVNFPESESRRREGFRQRLGVSERFT